MGQSTKSNGPRHLDRRTREGRKFYKRVGREDFAKARRKWATKSKKGGAGLGNFPLVGAGHTARKMIAEIKDRKVARTTVKTLPKPAVPPLGSEAGYAAYPDDAIDQAIESAEARLVLLRRIKANRVTMSKAIDKIMTGGTAEEASAILADMDKSNKN